MNTWRLPIYLLAPALLLCAAGAASAATWRGGFLSKSGITWTYEINTDNSRVSVSVQGDRQGTKFAAICADTAILDAKGSFEAACQYTGNPLTFKLRGQLQADQESLNYLADNGDHTSVKVLRQASAPSVSQPPQVAAAPRPTPPAPSAPAAASPGSAPFGDCRQAATLSQAYAARSFADKRPVLGIPGTDWTETTLDQALRWAHGCLDAARARGDVVPPQATVDRDLAQFAASATEGMARRQTRADNERLVAEFLDTPTTFPGGEPITCRALIDISQLAERLMGNADNKNLLRYNRVLGKNLQEMTDEDIGLLDRKMVTCRETANRLREQGLLTSGASLDQLDFKKWRSMVLLGEASARRDVDTKEAENDVIRQAQTIAEALAHPTSTPTPPSALDTSANGEVPACNAPIVTTTLVNASYGKELQAVVKLFANAPSAPMARALIEFNSLNFRVENIRQVKLDSENHARFCSAQFAFNGMNDIQTLGANLKTLCPNTGVSYKVEKLLDKPGQIYVSYRCGA